MKKIALIIGILLSAYLCLFFGALTPVSGKHLNSERFYQDLWCAQQSGQVEVRQIDGTRVDCLTEDMACEVDFASHKIYEGISQALHYGMLTGKQAALLLIVEKPGDWKYVGRARTLIDFYKLPVILFVIEPEKSEK